MKANSYTVTLGATCLEITPQPVANNTKMLIAKEQIVSVVPVKINQKPAAPEDQFWKYRFTKMIVVCLQLSDGGLEQIELQEVTNQAGWTANLAGQQQCVADINAWL